MKTFIKILKKIDHTLSHNTVSYIHKVSHTLSPKIHLDDDDEDEDDDEPFLFI
ncbi:hypothetical protein [Aquimarina agarivorans]|uniref:hypothetical protein n=1 Tax=Aquimarina agarivorans TaxID=980584 RepID=UPI0002E2C9FF|nr:hypothetical protein [Aquimarina agarivorans]